MSLLSPPVGRPGRWSKTWTLLCSEQRPRPGQRRRRSTLASDSVHFFRLFYAPRRPRPTHSQGPDKPFGRKRSGDAETLARTAAPAYSISTSAIQNNLRSCFLGRGGRSEDPIISIIDQESLCLSCLLGFTISGFCSGLAQFSTPTPRPLPAGRLLQHSFGTISGHL